MTYVHPRFEELQEKRVLVVECLRARSPAFVREGQAERFYIRAGASTVELTMSQFQDYARRHFAMA
jgi:hypothetical protein